MREIHLHSRKYLNLVALVDDEDYDRVNALRWNPQWDPRTRSFYAKSSFDTEETKSGRTSIFMGPFIMAVPRFDLERRVVDHIDHNTLNYQKANLRVCSYSQNHMNENTRENATSGFKGVSWDKEKSLWRVRVSIDKVRTQIGYYSDPVEAARAYDEAARKYHGPYARTNF